MVYKNIIFDLGGVLINLKSDKEWIEELAKVIRIEGLQLLKNNGFFEEFELGNISNEEFLSQLLQFAINHETSYTQVINAWNSILLNFNGVNINRVKTLSKNHNIFLLSNTNSMHEEAFVSIGVKQFGYDIMQNTFIQKYYSHVMGMRKPNHEAYAFILEQQKLVPQETLFVDDKIENIKAANAMRINTLHHKFNHNFQKSFI